MTEDYTNMYKAIANKVKVARVNAGYNINQLAKEVGEQYTIIKRIESGEPFSFHHAVWIQEILGINISDFLRGEYDEGSEGDGFNSLI